MQPIVPTVFTLTTKWKMKADSIEQKQIIVELKWATARLEFTIHKAENIFV